MAHADESDESPEATSLSVRVLCRECYGSGERRVQQAAIIPSTEALGGTAIVLQTCKACGGEGWFDA
jgi:DnaJ-class molecular chaperone